MGHRDAGRIERLLRGAGLLEKDKTVVGDGRDEPDVFNCKALTANSAACEVFLLFC